MQTSVRHLAAIMFTDMVGYSATTQRDEIAALRLVEEQDRLLRPIFTTHAGRVVKTMGDGFLVEFGSALAATRCAIEVRDRLAEYNLSHKDAPLDLRIGIHLGDVVEEGGDVFGDAVNVASRVEPLASKGGICVSQAVYEQVLNKVPSTFVRLDRSTLKNIDFPWAIYRVEARRPATARGRAPDVPLVERATELERLKQIVNELREGRGGIVMLSGEAGIGKTRLLEEIARSAAEEGVLVSGGRAREGEYEPPLAPWVDALRGLIYEISPGELIQDAGLHAVVLGRYLPDLLMRLGEPSVSAVESEPERYVVFEAVTRLLVNASHRRALLVILEDLHWADEASLRLLEFVGRNAATEPVLCIGSFRSEELGERHPLTTTLYELNRLRPIEQILLGPLSEAGVGALVARTLGVTRVDPALTSVIGERAAGNPLFAREIALALRREGRVAILGESAVLSGGPVLLPPTVQPLLERRVRALAPGTLELLRTASVLGLRFSADTLQSLSGLEGPVFLDRVDGAIRAGVLRERPIDSDTMLSFADARLRDYLYEGVSFLRRRALHKDAAECLVARRAPADELAYHFDRARDLEKARLYYERAGDEALALGDYERATERFEGALRDCPPDDRPFRRRVGVKVGRAQQEAGRLSAAVHALLEARVAVDRPEDDVPIATWLSAAYMGKGQFEASEREIDAALHTLGPATTAEAADAWSGKCVLLVYTGRPGEAVAAGERTLDISRQLGRPELISQALNNLTYAFLTDGRWEEALRCVTQRLDTSDEGLRPFEAAITLLDAAQVLAAVPGDLTRSLEFFQRAIERFHWMGIVASEMYARLGRAEILLATGQWAALEKEMAEGAARAGVLGGEEFDACCNLVRSELEWSRGDLAAAEASLEKVLAALPEESQGRQHIELTAHLQRALVLADSARVSAAREEVAAWWADPERHRCGRCSDRGWYVAARVEAADLGGDPRVLGEAAAYASARATVLGRAKLQASLARWARLHGAPSDSGLAEAAALLREKRLVLHLEETLNELAATLEALGRAEESEASRAEALRICAELGVPNRRPAD